VLQQQLHEAGFFSMEAFKMGDGQAFKALFTRYYQPLCYFSRQIAGEQGAAEEIAVDSFLKAWQRHKEFETLPALKAFLYIAARNASLDHLKKERRRQRREERWHGDLGEVEGSSNTLLNRIIKTEVLQEIRQAIALLPRHYEQVLDLSFNQGLKSKEIAGKLGIPLSTVDSRKTRGLDLLKKLLSDKSFLTVLLLLHHNSL